MSFTFWTGAAALLPPNGAERAAAGAVQPHLEPLAALPAAPEAHPDALGTLPQLAGGVAVVAVLHCCCVGVHGTRPPLPGIARGCASWLPARSSVPRINRCLPPEAMLASCQMGPPLLCMVLGRSQKSGCVKLAACLAVYMAQSCTGPMQAHHHSHFRKPSQQGPVPRPAGCPAARNQSVISICGG